MRRLTQFLRAVPILCISEGGSSHSPFSLPAAAAVCSVLVSIQPGLMAFTLMPYGAPSAAKDLVMPSTPDLATPYNPQLP